MAKWRVKTFTAAPISTGEEHDMTVEEALAYLDECVNKLEGNDIISIEDTIIPITIPVKGCVIARRVHYVTHA